MKPLPDGRKINVIVDALLECSTRKSNRKFKASIVKAADLIIRAYLIGGNSNEKIVGN